MSAAQRGKTREVPTGAPWGYTAAWGLLLALASPLLLTRLRHHPREMHERTGRWAALPEGALGGLWVHAASVGEARAAERLLGALAARGRRPILSVVTPAARALEAQLLAAGALAVRHAPLDFTPWVRATFEQVHPSALLVLETEIWPGLLWEARRRRIPLAFVSARLTPRGAARLRGLRSWLRRVLTGVAVTAQSEDDRIRWEALGVHPERIRVTGNLKYDSPRPLLAAGERAAALRGWKRVVVFGSVHSAEADAIATAVRICAAAPRPLLMVVVPRHPQRGEQALRRALGATLPVMRRARVESALLPTPEELLAQTAPLRGRPRGVLIVSTVGELRRYYEIADAAFVGGTLAPIGGHNLFEAAECGLPVFFGPHTENVADVAAALVAAGGGACVRSGEQLGQALLQILTDEGQRTAAATAARKVAESMGGALERTLDALEAWGFPVGPVQPQAGDSAAGASAGR